MFYRHNIIARSFQVIDGVLINYIDSPNEKSDNSVSWLNDVNFHMEMAVSISETQANLFGPRRDPTLVNQSLMAMCKHLRNAQLCLAFAMLDVPVQEALEIMRQKSRKK